MVARPTRLALMLATSTLALSHNVVVAGADVKDAHSLPIFFFHGRTANAKIADGLKANLTTEARPFVALTFCQDGCSTGDLNHQTDLAIAQIRGIVGNDSRFADGYSFIGHSQGGALARSVIENMDDHKVHTFISLAGAGNGIFYGPQANDVVPAQVFLKYFAPLTPKEVYDYSNYTDADITSGKLQLDRIKFEETKPEHQSQLTRSPNEKVWVGYNTFFPKLNNLQEPATKDIIAEQARRKNNFLKIKEAHYFASMFDETISPWQSAINGQYEDVGSFTQLAAQYKDLKVWSMTETPEYKQDLYGLQTLDKRGGLFLHTVEKVSHVCWVTDATSPRDGKVCEFMPVFAKTYYPLLAPVAVQDSPVMPHC